MTERGGEGARKTEKADHFIFTTIRWNTPSLYRHPRSPVPLYCLDECTEVHLGHLACPVPREEVVVQHRPEGGAGSRAPTQQHLLLQGRGGLWTRGS